MLIEWVDALPQSKKSVPKDIHDPVGLIAEMRVNHSLSVSSFLLLAPLMAIYITISEIFLIVMVQKSSRKVT